MYPTAAEADQMAVDDGADDGKLDDDNMDDGGADDVMADDGKAAKPRSERYIRNQARLNRNSHRRRDEKKAEKRARAARDSKILASSATNHQGKQVFLHAALGSSSARRVGATTVMHSR